MIADDFSPPVKQVRFDTCNNVGISNSTIETLVFVSNLGLHIVPDVPGIVCR